MLIPMVPMVAQLPAGPPPPELEGRLVCTRWLVMVSLSISMARLVLEQEPLQVLGDIIGALAGVMMLQHDAVLGGCAKCLQNSLSGLCGPGGFSCAPTFMMVNLVNGFFGIYTVCQIGFVYNHFCMGDTDDSHGDGAQANSTAAARLLLAGHVARALTDAAAAGSEAAGAGVGGSGSGDTGGMMAADGTSPQEAREEKMKDWKVHCPSALVLGIIVLAQTLIQIVCAQVTKSMIRTVQEMMLEQALGGPGGPWEQALQQDDEIALQQALALSRNDAFGPGSRGPVGFQGQGRTMGGGAAAAPGRGGGRGGGGRGGGGGDEDVELQRAIMNSQADAFAGRAYRLG